MVINIAISAVAEEELSDPGITPDSWLYGIDRAFERISLALTFDRVAKAEKHLQIASERIAELRAMIDKGKPEFVEMLKRDHEIELNESESDMENARALGRNVTVLAEHVANVTLKHITILQDLLDRVPEQAKPAIEHAINVSQMGHERAVESILKEKGRLENVTRGRPDNITTGKSENITRGKLENKTVGKPENVTHGRPENMTKDKFENVTKGKSENKTTERLENKTVGKSENVTRGKPEDITAEKPENKTIKVRK